ncbi:MAG: carboxypeptidase regulatory-like domain-containing protein [Thermoplasmatota archaeon]
MKIVEARCPNCDEELLLRPPKGTKDGEFTFECQGCGKEMMIRILDSKRGKFRIEPVKKASKVNIELSGISKKKRSKVMIEEEEEIVPAKVEDSLETRLMVAVVIMGIVAVLGVASAVSTLTGSFGIKDLDEQSPSDHASLTIWALDSTTGQGIEGVTVTLTSGEGNVTATTDTEGLAVIDRIMTGEMEIRLIKDGYKVTEGEITVRKGVPNVLDIPMERGSPSESIPILTVQFESQRYSTFITDIMAVLMFLASIMAVVAAYSIYKKEFYLLAVVSTFLSIFSFGFFIGAILSTIALLIIIFSYDKFYHTHLVRWFLENRGREDIAEVFTHPSRILPRLPPSDDDEKT